jgi:hypothetical protein
MLKLVQNLYAAVIGSKKVSTCWAYSADLAANRMAKAMSPSVHQKWVRSGREVIQLK